MKKVIGQTVRDLKRGVNKKVLKVPSIEQKVLDATSNEPWGPHGTLLADIAQATRNYHEYQMIMSILWKRAHDTGKNWRHVFKALSVLEYLVAHGSERVIDDIREHAYQLQTLSDFQYIDSGGRDQGSNIRKKSHGLVALVNDKEKIQEVREKAASNREKFRNTPPGSYSGSSGYGDRHDDERYGSRDDERNGNGRGREYGHRGDDRYAYGRDGGEYEERHGDDYHGRSPSVDNHSSRGRSSDRDKFEDDDQYSSRGSGARADEQSQDGRPFDHTSPEKNLGAPPSYEEAVSGPEIPGPTRSPTQSERDGETSEAAPNPASPPPSSSPTQATRTGAPAPTPNMLAEPAVNGNGADAFDEFDPRGSYSAASTTSSGAARTMSVGGEMDLLGSLSNSFTGNPLDVVPSSAPAVSNQGFDDPFGDGPFRAIASTDGAANQHQQGFGSMSFESGFNQDPELPQHVSQGAAEGSFSDSNPTPFGTSNVEPSGGVEGFFSGTNSTPFGASDVQPSQGAAEGSFSGSNLTPFGNSNVQTSSAAEGFFSGTNSTPFGASNVQPSGGDEGFFSGTNSTPFGDSNVPPSQDATEGAFSGTNSTPFGDSNVQSSSMDSQYQQPEFSSHDSSIDILADILPPTGPQPHVHPEMGYAAPVSQPVPQSGFLPQTGQNVSPATFSSQSDPTAHQSELSAQSGQPSPLSDQHVGQANFLPTGENMSQATFSPQSGATARQTSFSAQSEQSAVHASFEDQPGQLVVHPNFPSQFGQPPTQAGFAAHGGQPPSSNGYINQAPQAQQTGFAAQPASVSGFPHQMSQSQHGGFQSLPGGQAASPSPLPYGNYNMHSGYGGPVGQTMAPHSAGPNSQLNATNFTVASQTPFSSGQVGSRAPMPSQSEPPSTALIPSTTPSAKPKQFQTKSTVWTDTLSRGLVNLDISGVKTNPMSDIGIDFDAINRKEKRMEKPVSNPVTSTIHMGKAMGSGSGMGRASAGAARPSSNPTMGTSAGASAGAGTNMGMMGMGGPRPGVGMGGGGYGGMNQQAMGAGMGMNMQPNMGTGLPNMGMGRPNMGMGQPNMGMGQQNMGMGQQNMGMGQPNMGMGQQSMGMGHQNMGMGQPNMGMGQQNMGMGHQNMGMGQANMGMGFPNMGMGNSNMNMGGHMQQQGGYPHPPGSNMQGGYNPMMGSGNYGQNPYGGGGYR